MEGFCLNCSNSVSVSIANAKKEKGQANFEMLLATLFILVVALVVLSSWLSVSDETYAIIMFKDNSLDKLSKYNNVYTLGKVEVDRVRSNATDLYLNVYMDPVSIPSGLKDEIESIGTLIESKTKFQNAFITVQ